MKTKLIASEKILYSFLFFSLLFCACSTSQQETTGNKTDLSSNSDGPASTETIAENLQIDDNTDEVVADNASEVNTNSTSNLVSRSSGTQNTLSGDIISDKQNLVTENTLSHEVFDELLRTYVSTKGAVDYNGLLKNKSKVKDYLALLQNNPPQSTWSKNKEMAYWINMYNAFTISAVLEKYPINSIMDLEGGKVWDKKKIVVDGNSLTLNVIEKEKLLKRFKEPRVHFAVNCAAASCPPLLNKAWTEDNVQRYLAKQAKAFINNSKHNTLSENSIEISQIFNWYAGDFGGSDKILGFVQKYAETEIDNKAKVAFKEYIWKLNKK